MSTFLLSGGKLALANIVTGLTTLVYFGTISQHGADTGAAYGLAATYSAAVMMLGAGSSIMVMHRMRGLDPDRDGDAIRSHAVDITAAALMATTVLIVLLLALGSILTITDPTNLTGWAYWPRLLSMITVPVGSIVTGYLMAYGREGIVLKSVSETFVLNIAAAYLLSLMSLTPSQVLLVIGLWTSAVQLYLVARQWRGLRERASIIVAGFRAAVRAVTTTPTRYVSAFFTSVAGAGDGLVMMSSFLVITSLAVTVSAEAALVTGMLVTIMRSLVIPLKQFGLVGARLTAAAGSAGPERIRTFSRVMATIMIPIGLVFMVFPNLVTSVTGIDEAAPEMLTAVRLCGVQLMLEPVTGFLSGAMKVLIGPWNLLRSLAFAMFGIVIPITVAAFVLGHLSLMVIWGAMLLGRIFFFARTYLRFVAWRRRQEVDSLAVA